MSKASSSLLRVTLIRAADHARKQDRQLAKVYCTQMVERGADHHKANCWSGSPLDRSLCSRGWARVVLTDHTLGQVVVGAVVGAVVILAVM